MHDNIFQLSQSAWQAAVARLLPPGWHVDFFPSCRVETFFDIQLNIKGKANGISTLHANLGTEGLMLVLGQKGVKMLVLGRMPVLGQKG